MVGVTDKSRISHCFRWEALQLTFAKNYCKADICDYILPGDRAHENTKVICMHFQALVIYIADQMLSSVGVTEAIESFLCMKQWPNNVLQMMRTLRLCFASETKPESLVEV